VLLLVVASSVRATYHSRRSHLAHTQTSFLYLTLFLPWFRGYLPNVRIPLC
jgi:hypothetical protein